jgi:CheY-like chemotaxis protein
VNEVVDSVVKMLSRTIRESIDLRTALSPELPAVKIDPGRLEQVVVNLAVNAKDAMLQGGTLIVGTAQTHVPRPLASDDLPEGDYVAITVEDTGPGIPPQIAERIFEPFFTTKAKGHGTGLGLATVYGIVKQFRGHIEVETREGVGSKFTVYLPAADAEVEEISIPTLQPLQGTGTILVAEDSAPLRKLVKRILEKSSYKVIEAESGAEAFRLWQGHAAEIDLLLTDVIMPRMSGRELSELTGLPTVFVSGYTDEIISAEEISESDFFLQKPFSANDLLAVVVEALATSPPAHV